MAEAYYVSKKYHLVSELAKKTAKRIARNGEEWTKFLGTAARLYKYPFEDQMLIYAQRPGACACAALETWNKKMFCWVNRGAKGIALIDRKSERPRLRYVFDVSDVHKARWIGRDPYLWKLEEKHKNVILTQLEKTYGDTNFRQPFEERLIEIAGRIAQDAYGEHLQDLTYEKDGSLLEELDDLNVGLRLKETLASTIAFVLLSRCGADMDVWRGELDFQYISEFNTPRALSVMGNAAADLCKPVLMEIGRTVAEFDRWQQKQNARNKAKESAGRGQYGGRGNKSEIGLANAPEMDYNALKRENEGQASKADGFSAGKKFDKETEGMAYGTDIREERGLPDSEPGGGQRTGEPLTKYGLMRKDYLEKNHRGIFSGMLLEGTLWNHCLEVQRQAQQRMDYMTERMAKAEGVDEKLKASDQMSWVRKMNAIRHSAEESVLAELVYSL